MKLLKLSIVCVLLLASVSCTAQIQGVDSGSDTAAVTIDDTQFEINKSALLTGTNEQVRIMAAQILLTSESPKAREVVLDILNNQGNADARSAICKVISQSRMSPDIKILNKEQLIDPLLNLIKETGHPLTPLASEALLVFDYDIVGIALQELARDASLDQAIRLNAMNALKLRLDRRGLIALIGLVDDPETPISDAAKEMLHSISIPVGNSMLDRIRFIEELERKSKDEFLRDWVFRQDERLQQERAQVDMWKRLYKEALDKHYNQADNSVREALIIEHLKAPQSFRKLWAIDKVYKWRTQANTEWPDSLTPVLTGLISDSDKIVRLNAATQLFSILKIDSAGILIQQLDSEKEADVRTELFAVLGEACRAALVGEGVPADIKAKTLEWAARFLTEPNADQAVKGADVIGRLLEKNGLDEADIEIYLGLLKNRYEQELAGDVAIKRNLLRTMGLLCAESSGCKRQARSLYKTLFDQGLEDESPLVREEAVQGLISIDPTAALEVLRGKLASEISEKVRARIITLSKEVGSIQDLDWLAARIEAGTEADVSWQAILTILSRAEDAPFESLFERFLTLKTQGKLTVSQWEGLLEVLLTKVSNNTALLRKVHWALADYCLESGALERAKTHLTTLLRMASESEQTEIHARLLSIELQSGRVKESAALLSEALKTMDLDTSHRMAEVVNEFLTRIVEGKDARSVVQSVVQAVEVTGPRPKWERLKSGWMAQSEGSVLEPASDTNTPS